MRGPISEYIAQLSRDFQQAFGFPPTYVYLGGRFLSEAFTQCGGRPIVMERLIVQVVKYDELGVGKDLLPEEQGQR